VDEDSSPFKNHDYKFKVRASHVEVRVKLIVPTSIVTKRKSHCAPETHGFNSALPHTHSPGQNKHMSHCPASATHHTHPNIETSFLPYILHTYMLNNKQNKESIHSFYSFFHHMNVFCMAYCKSSISIKNIPPSSVFTFME